MGGRGVSGRGRCDDMLCVKCMRYERVGLGCDEVEKRRGLGSYGHEL